MKNTLLILMLIIALALPLFAQEFPPVPADHWAYLAVQELLEAGILQNPDGTHAAKKAMTRYEFAELVATAVPFIKKYNPTIPVRSGASFRFVHNDADVRPVDGPNSYKWNNQIKALQKLRDEYIDELTVLNVDVVLLRLNIYKSQEEITTRGAQEFPVVPADHWAHQAVKELFGAGILQMPDGTPAEKKVMTRYEFAEMIATAVTFMKKAVPPEPHRPPAPPGTVFHFYHIDGYTPPVDTTKLIRLDRRVTKDNMTTLLKLLDEFRDELAALGVDVEALRRDIVVYTKRVTALDARGFPDVPADHWAYPALRELLCGWAIKGYPNGIYDGDRAMTRYVFAEAITTLIPLIEQRVKLSLPAGDQKE